MICLSYTSTEEKTDLYQNVQSFWLELNTCTLYIVIEQENYCFNIQNPINECFFSTFNIIRDALVVNNFLCKYFNKQLNPPCLHSSQLRLIPYLHHKRTYPRFADCRVCKHNFPEIHEVNLRTLTEMHVITFRKQLINLLYQPALAILVKLGEINMTPLIILNKTQSFNMDQAEPTGEHRIYAQTCTCTNSSFGFFSSLFLIIFLCSSIRLTQLILLQRRCFGPRYSWGRLFF